MKFYPEKRYRRFLLAVQGLLCLLVAATGSVCGQHPFAEARVRQNAFPATIQFLPPSPGQKINSDSSLGTLAAQHKAIADIITHGFSNLWIRSFTGDQPKQLLEYAQQRGMKIDFMTNGFELFNRYSPPVTSVYAPEYAAAVKKQVVLGLGQLKEIERVNYIFPFQDEPFHAGPESFDYSPAARIEFNRQYGYAMPEIPDSARKDPKKWLDLLNFQSNTFRDGWKQVYKIVKDFEPRGRIAITHDSHNPFGAGVHSNSKIAIDDVFHWGANFADVFVYDIYPYLTFDYRYGEPGKLPRPRISQMHYAISQLRNLTTAYGKELGFWVGTYNEAWFTRFRGPQRKRQYWSEREMAYTAIAQGADFLISPSNFSGSNIPEETHHWQAYGASMKLIQKAGPALLKAPRVKAKACFLFPRTQYLQLQEEYFNVGLSFELFLRSFGELDILHEEQVKDDALNGYKILVLGDISLLPVKTARHIAAFVRNGGVVIADCLPQLNEYKQPLGDMKEVFGVDKAETGRVVQQGQWVPFANLPPKMSFPPPADQPPPVVRTDKLSGKVFGKTFNCKIVSPRPAVLTDAKVLLKMASGRPALVSKRFGKGRAYLLGFCLQDAYFQTYKDSDAVARRQLRSLVAGITRDADIESHIYSSNPDIEAGLQANQAGGYIVIINHEALYPQTRISFRDPGFSGKKIIDLETGKTIPFKIDKNGGQFAISAPFGTTRLLRLLP